MVALIPIFRYKTRIPYRIFFVVKPLYPIKQFVKSCWSPIVEWLSIYISVCVCVKSYVKIIFRHIPTICEYMAADPMKSPLNFSSPPIHDVKMICVMVRTWW
jgi:hypothetical protein